MISRLAQAVVDAGADDWVPLRVIDAMSFEGQPGASLERRKAAVLRALAELLEAGLVTLGEVGDGGFFEWDVEDEAGHGMARLAAEYGKGDLAQWGFAVWVANTPKGNSVENTGQH